MPNVVRAGPVLLVNDGSANAAQRADAFYMHLKMNPDWTRDLTAGRFETVPVAGASMSFDLSAGRFRQDRYTRLGESIPFEPTASREVRITGYPIKGNIDVSRSRTKDMEGVYNSSGEDVRKAMAAAFRARFDRLLKTLNATKAANTSDTEFELKRVADIAGTVHFDTSSNSVAKAATTQPLNIAKLQALKSHFSYNGRGGQKLIPIAAEQIWNQLRNDPQVNHGDYSYGGPVSSRMAEMTEFNPMPEAYLPPMLYSNFTDGEGIVATTADDTKTFYVAPDAVKLLVPAGRMIDLAGQQVEMMETDSVIVEMVNHVHADTNDTRVWTFDNWVVCEPSKVGTTTDAFGTALTA